MVLIVCVEPNEDEEDINSICVEFSSDRPVLTSIFSCYYHNNCGNIFWIIIIIFRILPLYHHIIWLYLKSRLFD